MKKLLITLVIILAATFSQAQTTHLERFTLAVFSDPVATHKDGVNAGAEIEYQVNWFYVRFSTFVFPELRGFTYTDVIGSLGYNLHLNKLADYNWRMYTGLRLGSILRRGEPFATWGGEAGIDHYFQSGFFLGVRATLDRRTDATIWGHNEKPYWGESGYIRIGFEL